MPGSHCRTAGQRIRDLHLLKKKFSKPASSTLVVKNDITLQSDGYKLNRWAEYSKEVVNCQVDVDVVSVDALSVVPLSPASSDTALSDEDLSAPLSEEEIHTAISKLSSGRASGLNRITLEMLSLGRDVTVRWLKAIFDAIWATESVPEDWLSQLLVPLHKKAIWTICDNYRGIALRVYQVKCLPRLFFINSRPELSCSSVKAIVALGKGGAVLTNCFPCR